MGIPLSIQGDCVLRGRQNRPMAARIRPRRRAPPTARPATLREVVGAVSGASSASARATLMRRDAVAIRPHQVIIVGVVLAALLVVLPRSAGTRDLARAPGRDDSGGPVAAQGRDRQHELPASRHVADDFSAPFGGVASSSAASVSTDCPVTGAHGRGPAPVDSKSRTASPNRVIASTRDSSACIHGHARRTRAARSASESRCAQAQREFEVVEHVVPVALVGAGRCARASRARIDALPT